MKLLRVVGSLDPAEGGLSQAIRSSAADLNKLGILTEVVCCDSPEALWLGRDSFPVYALGPRRYGFAYTPKLRPWLEENLGRFDAVIIDGLWLWPSVCAVRAVARERRRRLRDQETKRLRGEEAENDCGVTGKPKGAVLRKSGVSDAGNNAILKDRNSEELKHGAKQLRCFVMPHGMLDPWFQRDRSRRVKAVRNWFYWWLIERGVVNSADALLFTCQQELELARTTFGGYRPKKEIVVGLGIEEPPAFEPKMREAFAARCPGLNGRPYLLFMSRIHAKKNVAALVRAYARVRSEVTSDVCRVTSGQSSGEVLRGLKDQGSNGPKDVEFPDLVIAGPGWESDYGREVRGLIDGANGGQKQEIGNQRPETVDGEDAAATRARHSAQIHAVGMLSGAAKWGALYGCEAFVLPSHQENFGIAVVEALACGKPVLISDQVNIWREIVEDGAGMVEADTEEGVEKLLKKFLNTPRDETSDLRPEVRTKPRECYLKRFAIGPAAGRLAEAVLA